MTKQRRSLKCMVLGDSQAGKTAMLMSYVTGTCPRSHNATIFDHYSVSVDVGKDAFTLELYDTAGEAGYDSLRSLAYSQTDVCIICFSVVQPSSLKRACTRWLSEIRQHLPNIPVVLVGTKTDLRENAAHLGRLVSQGLRPVTRELGEKTAKRVGAAAYVECSAINGDGLKAVFDSAILSGIGLRIKQTDKTKKEKALKKTKKGKSGVFKPWKCAFMGVARLGKRLSSSSSSSSSSS